MNYFHNEYLVDLVHERSWTTGTPVHDGPTMDEWPKLIGAWPPVAPGLKNDGQGAGEGDPFRASLNREMMGGGGGGGRALRRFEWGRKR
jgi:hypothetical protein